MKGRLATLPPNTLNSTPYSFIHSHYHNELLNPITWKDTTCKIFDHQSFFSRYIIIIYIFILFFAVRLVILALRWYIVDIKFNMLIFLWWHIKIWIYNSEDESSRRKVKSFCCTYLGIIFISLCKLSNFDKSARKATCTC